MTSQKKSNENNNNEEEIILNLINDIFQYENKIQEVNNLLIDNNADINNDHTKLSELKNQKLNLNQKISDIDQNLSQYVKNKDTQLKLKESMKNEIENKIQEYKYKINTLNSLSFNPIITKKIFPNNQTQNEILTNEQINDILTNVQNLKNFSEDETNTITDEIINMNKDQEKDLIKNINNLKSKICQIDEQLKMLKEEKYSTNNELINIISCKETIEALIKFNHYLIKNYIKENNENKNINNINNIDEEKNSDEEIYNKNKWTEPTQLYFYELCTLDSEEFSLGFNDIIIDLYDINNNKSFNNNKIKLELPSIKRNSTNSKKDNNITNNNTINNNVFSISKILKKEFEFFVKKSKNNPTSTDQGDDFMNNFLEKISNTIISKLKLFLSKKFNNQKFSEINKNIIIYLSYYLKSLYYEKIINSCLKFVNKEYKYNKKELQNINNDINVEIKKLELKQKDIHQQINYNEREINKIQNESIKKKLIDNLKNENMINLSKNEQEYLQLCSKINNLLLQRDEVNSICEKINNEFKSKQEEIELEKNKINKQITDINKEIKNIEDNLEQKKLKANKEIIEYRKIIADKYNKIKSQLKICKKKYGDDTEQYNSLVNNINKTIKLKNTDHLNIKDLDNIRLTGNSEIIPKTEIYKFTISSYEDDEKSNFKKNKKRNLNRTGDKIYNLEFSTTKSCSKNLNSNRNNSLNNNNLKLSKDKKNLKLHTSNKLQKHTNYLKKYFNTNSNQNNDEHNKNEDKDFKSDKKYFTQTSFYPGFKSISGSMNNTAKTNNHNNYFNQRMSYHENSTRITDLLDKYSKNIPFYEASPNSNKINSVNLHKNIYSLRNDKMPYNINDNTNHSKNNNKGDKLSKTINELKNNIIKNEKLSYNYFEKIKILTKITFCFFRNNNKNFSKYNPINKISNENLCKSPYHFMKSSISLNKSYESIRIGLTTQLDPIDINLKDIEYTVVNSSMKMMIEIYRDYKKYNKNNSDKFDKNLFIKEEMEKNSNLSYEYINKCIDNKKFNFILFVQGNQQMEFIFCSYEDFKTWINGLAYIIQNKKKLLEFIGKI